MALKLKVYLKSIKNAIYSLLELKLHESDEYKKHFYVLRMYSYVEIHQSKLNLKNE